ncbi:hypothetical protein [Noviherbaspirillum sedimenti]|uniref:Uncharacterized protein n=1 Tax=Noviherbaspirillum sedimenti TaxID=2320865 RepID=A0A3A3G376_9BURK|nr:hypothetical protein [Noviherbaspirillum sedimenti]RJG01269.1 hypothetical protein D3878_06455 [Noviherbaspirillum sedimenti]
MNLADIVQGNWLEGLATAIPAIHAIPDREGAPTIATIAKIAVANPPKEKTIVQIDPFLDRRDRLHRAGLSEDDAALMAFKLERRDLEQDDRHLCIECSHLHGGAKVWRCTQWHMRQQTGPDIPSDLVTVILHRCGGFNGRLEAAA